MSSRFKPRRIHCEMHLQEVSRQLQLLVKQLHTCSDIDEKKEDSCVPSSDFFDHNLHVENGVLSLKPVCMDSSE